MYTLRHCFAICPASHYLKQCLHKSDIESSLFFWLSEHRETQYPSGLQSKPEVSSLSQQHNGSFPGRGCTALWILPPTLSSRGAPPPRASAPAGSQPPVWCIQDSSPSAALASPPLPYTALLRPLLCELQNTVPLRHWTAALSCKTTVEACRGLRVQGEWEMEKGRQDSYFHLCVAGHLPHRKEPQSPEYVRERVSHGSPPAAPGGTLRLMRPSLFLGTNAQVTTHLHSLSGQGTCQFWNLPDPETTCPAAPYMTRWRRRQCLAPDHYSPILSSANNVGLLGEVPRPGQACHRR